MLQGKRKKCDRRSRSPSRYGTTLTLATCLAVFAQAGAAAAADQPAAAGEAVAEDAIIVTAQRRSERLEDVPMSVSVISGDAAEKSGALSLHNIQSLAPGVMVSFGGSNTQPSVRGVTTNIAGSGAENNVAVYVDGFYTGSPTAINMDLVNLESIQVLKGPQGSLYGRNATGGAILITTLPASDRLTGKLEAGYASFDEKTFSGYLSGPLSDHVRFSIAGYSRTGDGYLELVSPVNGLPSGRPAAPTQSQSVRVKLEADLTPDLTATLAYNYAYVDDYRTLIFTPFQYISPAIPASSLPARRDPDLKAYNGQSTYLDRSHQGTLTLAWRTGLGMLKLYGGYAHTDNPSSFDTDGSFSQLAYNPATTWFDTYQGTVDYAIDAIANLDLIVGATYYDDHRISDPILTLIGGTLSARATSDTRRRAYAGYVDASYHLNDKLTLSLGGRYSHEKVDTVTSSQTAAQIGTSNYTVAPRPVSAGFGKFTPRASIRYELAPQASVYASFSQGFKSGGWSGTPATVVRPETITAYEVGFKIARPTFRFEAAGFYYDYKDIQLSVNVRDPLCTTTICTLRPLVTNGPKSEIYGVDGQLTLMPVDRLNVRIGLAYLHARYKSFPNAAANGLNILANTNISNQNQDWTGRPMPRSPNFSGNVNVDYTIPSSIGEFALSANATFSTSYVVSNPSLYGPAAGALANVQRYVENGYVMANAQISWTDRSDHVTITAFVRNLNNARFWASYTGFAFGDYGILSSPRVIGGKVGFKF